MSTQITNKGGQGVSYLVKHSAAVHIDNSLSLLERKVFNILLKNAYNALLKKSEHQLRINDLSYQIGWEINSKQNAELKKALISINGTQVTWNILNKDKKNTWGVASLISGAEITNGVISYRFDEKVRILLANPSIYARLNMEVHQKFRSKYAYILWEFFVEILGSNNTDSVAKYEISLIDFRKFLVITDKYTEFKDLNRAILAPAIKEINKVSDIEVRFEPKRQARKVNNLIFSINKKKEFQHELDYILERRKLIVSSKLETLGLSTKTCETVFAKYKIDNVELALLITETDMLKNDILNPAAYFMKALEGGWKLAAKMTEKKNEIIESAAFDEDYEKNIKDKDWRKVRDLFQKQHGAAVFNSWIKEVQLSAKGEGSVTLKAKTRFIAEYIEKNYLKDLKKYWSKTNANITEVNIAY